MKIKRKTGINLKKKNCLNWDLNFAATLSGVVIVVAILNNFVN